MKATIQIKEEDRKIRHEIVHSFECKDVLTDPILMMCCKQILGCQQICLRNNDVIVLGLDSLLATLRSVRSNWTMYKLPHLLFIYYPRCSFFLSLRTSFLFTFTFLFTYLLRVALFACSIIHWSYDHYLVLVLIVELKGKLDKSANNVC